MALTQTYRKASNVNPYLYNEIMEAAPQKLLIKVYDFAIANCQNHNLEKTNKAISVLISSLNFENPETKELSLNLFGLYQFCQEQMRQKNYDIVYKILTELRDTWLIVLSGLKKEK
jgi:flagellar protein FliS